MKITYDAEADAAYIYLSTDKAVLRQTIVQISPSGGEVILDVDDHGTLRGIEILGASTCLPPAFLEQLRASGNPT